MLIIASWEKVLVQPAMFQPVSHLLLWWTVPIHYVPSKAAHFLGFILQTVQCFQPLQLIGLRWVFFPLILKILSLSFIQMVLLVATLLLEAYMLVKYSMVAESGRLQVPQREELPGLMVLLFC